MIRKLNGILVSVSRWLKRLFGKKGGGKEERTEDGLPVPLPSSLLRIRRILDSSGVRRRRGGAPGVWITKADDFSGAYRFMLRLCAPKHIVCIRQAGHIRYKALLPDGEGSILLSDRVGNRKDTVAVMTFAVGKLPEIRFSPRGKGGKP